MDRMSNLPDEIIWHIGSFLSAKEASFAMVLSKRWKNLFTIIPDLQFDTSVNKTESFTDFVDGVLAIPVTFRIRKFSLKLWEDTEPARYDYINHCLCHVVKLGVLDLELRINGKQGYYTLPFEVFTCETLTKLTLGSGFAIDFLPASVFLPALKTLCIYSIRFGRCCAFNTFLSVCPVLEELVMRGINWEHWKRSCNISSTTLQRLIIRRDECEESKFQSISLDTPRLTYFEYYDFVPKQFLTVNLDSLVEAKLDLSPQNATLWSEEDVKRYQPINFLNGLKNVKTLTLYTTQTLQMFYVFREAMLVFEKLRHLSVALSDRCWIPFSMLIKKSPNLKTLTINGPLHYNNFYDYSFLSSCLLEVLKMNEFNGTLRELTQLKYMLKELSSLELVEIHAKIKCARSMIEAELEKLPRASSKCKFKVFA